MKYPFCHLTFTLSFIFFPSLLGMQNNEKKLKKIKIVSNHFNEPPQLLYENLIKNYCNRQTQDKYSRKYDAILETNRENEFENFKKLVFKGGNYAHKVINNQTKKLLEETPDSYKNAVTAVVSFLYSLTLYQSKTEVGSTQLSIILKDPHSYWFNFFIQRYIGICSLKEDKSNYIFQLTKKTKHLPLIKKSPHFALKLGKYAPNEANHLIVIQDKEKKLLFIKPRKDEEPEGYGLIKIVNGFKSVLKDNKSIGTLIGMKTNDDPSYNKEHFQPKWLTQQFLELFPDEQIKPIYKIVQDILAAIKIELSEDRIKELRKLLTQIQRRWNYLDIRMGNEFIFDDEIPITAYYYYGVAKNPKVIENYYIMLQPFLTFKSLLFQNNVLNKKDIMQKMRNSAWTIINDNKEAQKYIPVPLKEYFNNIATLLRCILKSYNCDNLLCEMSIFEQMHQKNLLEEFESEVMQSINTKTTSDEYLLLPNQKLEQE